MQSIIRQHFVAQLAKRMQRTVNYQVENQWWIGLLLSPFYFFVSFVFISLFAPTQLLLLLLGMYVVAFIYFFMRLTLENFAITSECIDTEFAKDPERYRALRHTAHEAWRDIDGEEGFTFSPTHAVST